MHPTTRFNPRIHADSDVLRTARTAALGCIQPDPLLENDMKVSTIALTFAACALTASAYAANPATDMHTQTDAPHAVQWTPAANAPHAKTRAEVRQELVRAQKDGQLAAINKFYQGS